VYRGCAASDTPPKHFMSCGGTLEMKWRGRLIRKLAQVVKPNQMQHRASLYDIEYFTENFAAEFLLDEEAPSR